MRERSVRAMEAGAITLFALILMALARHLWLRQAPVWLVVAAAFLGYLGGDLASGIAHWFCDNFFEEDSPLIGPLLIHPFREHHRDPLGMTSHGFLELTGNSCLAMLPVMMAVVEWRDRIGSLPETAFLFFCVTLFATNLFHKWAHAADVPRLVRFLQRHWLILPPAHHQKHHLNGYSGAYCITSGWMSSALDSLLRTK